MLITMGNPDLVRKLLALADNDIDLVQHAIRKAAGDSAAADLEKVVEYIVRQQRLGVATNPPT
jgi:hypothetical protein